MKHGFSGINTGGLIMLLDKNLLIVIKKSAVKYNRGN
jgi:hypothetical protein